MNPCPAGRAVAQPASALLHGDAVFLHEQCRKFLEGGGLVQHSVDLLSQLVQLGLVDGLGGLLPFGGKFGVGMVEAALSAPLRPILALRNMVALGFQQIDLVQVGLLAHLHDCDTEVPEHGRGAAVLLARFPVARLVHEGLPFHGADTQAADDDVDVDVPGTVVTVRVGADDGGMTGEVVLAELQAKGLRPFHGQAVLYCVLRVEADDIMVGLHVLPPAVLAVLAIGNQAGHSKRRFAALKGVEQVRIPQFWSAVPVQNRQTRVLVMLEREIALSSGIVRVFRGHADCSCRLLTLEKIAEVIFYSQFGAAGLLLDGCHTVHQPFLQLSAESS